jgi:hypothetical protein
MDTPCPRLPNRVQNLGLKKQRKETNRKPRIRLEDNIRIDLEEIG